MMRIFLLAAVVSGIAVAVPKVVDGQLGYTTEETAKPIRQTTEQAPVAAYAGGRDVVIAADARGHYLSNFRINGKQIAGLIDTGATAVAINRSTARQIGVYLTPSMFTYRINTANGTTRAARVMLQSVELKSIRVRNVEAYVLDDNSLGATLIGMSFLNRLTSFQARDGKLILKL
ncbi:TIGR02281 family clan AA aspartic protease [Hoeflea prorocentri]|uniref:TIGR02281 family clan AA aspartic protease n=1 Tax=Hoeflea prorocentri TaxID=1922333 RepID=A0A9X3ZJH4_9HYPH|nr:TIGR02281 family clan AA aspartic protease [Hoeflea prorocentri]MCY6382981.1 TIGR02281 family clan AA aspartic protease [Hoeflea prorocentri]MDA5400781.1 TIGR02281 family clan AA aspartic protease [Hoeflea prorocentri]